MIILSTLWQDNARLFREGQSALLLDVETACMVCIGDFFNVSDCGDGTG